MKTLLLKTAIFTLLLATVFSCCCPSSPNPDGTITAAEAEAMANLYEANQYFYINENIEGQDNLSINFKMEDLEDFICLAKDEAGDQGFTSLGLRVYLGAKNDTLEGGAIVPRTTVFFQPTSMTENSICDIPGVTLLNMGDIGNNEFGSVNCGG